MLIISAAFRFDDLRVIDVSGCNLITSVGFQAFAMQNRRIEELTASSCTGLENEGTLIFLKTFYNKRNIVIKLSLIVRNKELIL